MSEAALQTQVSNTATLAVYTFTAADIGAADPARYVICAISAIDSISANFGITAATIGGIVATVVVQTQDTAAGCDTYIIIAAVPTGTTADIVITFLGTHIWCYVGVYRVVGLVSPTAHATAGNTVDPAASTINVPHNGLLIGCFSGSTAGTAVATTGVAELYDASFDGDRVAGGMSANLAAETPRTVEFNGGAGAGASWASWQLSFSLAHNPAPFQHMMTR